MEDGINMGVRKKRRIKIFQINTVGAVFKSIVLKPFLMGVLLQRGFYCSGYFIANLVIDVLCLVGSKPY